MTKTGLTTGVSVRCLLLVAVAAVLAGCPAPEAKVPKRIVKVEVVNVGVKDEIFLINGDLDAGFKVTGTVQNGGDRGLFEVAATLSCSEGEYTKKRTLLLEQNQNDVVAFDFPEPTANATNAKAIIRVRATE
jgi:hypothetical protein